MRLTEEQVEATGSKQELLAMLEATATVRSHTRRSKSGKVATVKQHQRRVERMSTSRLKKMIRDDDPLKRDAKKELKFRTENRE